MGLASDAGEARTREPFLQCTNNIVEQTFGRLWRTDKPSCLRIQITCTCRRIHGPNCIPLAPLDKPVWVL